MMQAGQRLQMIRQALAPQHPAARIYHARKADVLLRPLPWTPLTATSLQTDLTECVNAGRAERLLQLDRPALAAELHDPEASAPFVLITARPVFHAARWGYLADLITRDQWALQATNRSAAGVSGLEVVLMLYVRLRPQLLGPFDSPCPRAQSTSHLPCPLTGTTWPT